MTTDHSTSADIRAEKRKTTAGLAAKLRRANDLGSSGVRFYKVDAVFNVEALVLGNSLWGLLCQPCRSRHDKIATLTGDNIPKAALRTLHDVLGKEMRFEFSEW